MMVNVCMNQHMIGALKALVGSTLCALECPRIDEWRDSPSDTVQVTRQAIHLDSMPNHTH